MAKTTEQFYVYVYTCDGCGRKAMVPEGDLPDGIHGTAFENGSWGGTLSVPWFACRLAHVATAVKNVLDRESEQGK